MINNNYTWTVIVSKNLCANLSRLLTFHKQFFMSNKHLMYSENSRLSSLNKKRQIRKFSSSLNLNSKHPPTLCCKFSQTFPPKYNNHSVVVKVCRFEVEIAWHWIQIIIFSALRTCAWMKKHQKLKILCGCASTQAQIPSVTSSVMAEKKRYLDESAANGANYSIY